MTKTSEEALIAILVEKLGGEVTITHEDFARADALELTRWDDSRLTMSYRLTAERPPEILVGEIVTAEPQSITPSPAQMLERIAHQCEPWQIRYELGSAPYCGACGKAAA